MNIIFFQLFIVRWEFFFREYQNGKIIGYKIRYKMKGVFRNGVIVITDGNRRLYVFINLEKMIEYQVRILVLIVNGSGLLIFKLKVIIYEDDLDGKGGGFFFQCLGFVIKRVGLLSICLDCIFIQQIFYFIREINFMIKLFCIKLFEYKIVRIKIFLLQFYLIYVCSKNEGEI